MLTAALAIFGVWGAYQLGKRTGFVQGANFGLAYAERHGTTQWERVQQEVARQGLQ